MSPATQLSPEGQAGMVAIMVGFWCIAILGGSRLLAVLDRRRFFRRLRAAQLRALEDAPIGLLRVAAINTRDSDGESRLPDDATSRAYHALQSAPIAVGGARQSQNANSRIRQDISRGTPPTVPPPTAVAGASSARYASPTHHQTAATAAAAAAAAAVAANGGTVKREVSPVRSRGLNSAQSGLVGTARSGGSGSGGGNSPIGLRPPPAPVRLGVLKNTSGLYNGSGSVVVYRRAPTSISHLARADPTGSSATDATMVPLLGAARSDSANRRVFANPAEVAARLRSGAGSMTPTLGPLPCGAVSSGSFGAAPPALALLGVAGAGESTSSSAFPSEPAYHGQPQHASTASCAVDVAAAAPLITPPLPNILRDNRFTLSVFAIALGLGRGSLAVLEWLIAVQEDTVTRARFENLNGNTTLSNLVTLPMAFFLYGFVVAVLWALFDLATRVGSPSSDEGVASTGTAATEVTRASTAATTGPPIMGEISHPPVTVYGTGGGGTRTVSPATISRTHSPTSSAGAPSHHLPLARKRSSVLSSSCSPRTVSDLNLINRDRRRAVADYEVESEEDSATSPSSESTESNSERGDTLNEDGERRIRNSHRPRGSKSDKGARAKQKTKKKTVKVVSGSLFQSVRNAFSDSPPHTTAPSSTAGHGVTPSSASGADSCTWRAPLKVIARWRAVSSVLILFVILGVSSLLQAFAPRHTVPSAATASATCGAVLAVLSGCGFTVALPRLWRKGRVAARVLAAIGFMALVMATRATLVYGPIQSHLCARLPDGHLPYWECTWLYNAIDSFGLLGIMLLLP